MIICDICKTKEADGKFIKGKYKNKVSCYQCRQNYANDLIQKYFEWF